MVKLSFEISDEAFNLLKTIGNGAAEYRDTEYGTVEEFENSDEFKHGIRTTDWFLNRNFDGTYHLIPELEKYGLVESDGMSWHMTYILTEFGKEILKNI